MTVCHGCQRPVEKPVLGEDGELYHDHCWSSYRRR